MAPRPAFWLPAAAAAIAAALALILVVPRPEARPPSRQAAPFFEIPGLPPLDPHENVTIVPMNIQVSTLIAIGYRVADDPEKTVPAEVLVGEDGRAHAVRVLADLNWNGTGD
jgi:hypothetical protein